MNLKRTFITILVGTTFLSLVFIPVRTEAFNPSSYLAAVGQGWGNIFGAVSDLIFGKDSVTSPIPSPSTPYQEVKKIETSLKPLTIETKTQESSPNKDQVLSWVKDYLSRTVTPNIPPAAPKNDKNVSPVLTIQNTYVTNTGGGSSSGLSDSVNRRLEGINGTVSGLLSSPSLSGVTTIASAVPATVGNVSSTVVTDVASIPVNYPYNDSQKSLVTGSDGFSRFVYFNPDDGDVHFVQCINLDCTTKIDTTIADPGISTDSATLVMAPDGYARIAYLEYTTPNELHFVRCTNDSCSTNIDTLVDTGNSVGLTYFYTNSITVSADGLASIVYDNYNGSVSKLRLAKCNDANCSSPTLTTLDTSGNYLEGVSAVTASDGFARITYADYSTTPDELHFIQYKYSGCHG
jgi:hypothetical protein